MSTRFDVHRTLKPRGMGLPRHVHDAAQLTYAASGMVQVHTDEGVWLVPPQLAVWIPPRVDHRLDVLTDTELWMGYIDPAAL